MNIEEIYKIYKDGNFKDKDMQRAFNRSITPETVQELLNKLEKLYRECNDNDNGKNS